MTDRTAAAARARQVAIQQAVRDYMEEYEFAGDNGDHSPTDWESLLIEDVIQGLIADEKFIAAFVAADAAPSGDMEVEALARGIEAASRYIITQANRDCHQYEMMASELQAASTLLRSLAAREARLREEVNRLLGKNILAAISAKGGVEITNKAIDAVEAAHSSGIAQGREEAAKWHDERAADWQAFLSSKTPPKTTLDGIRSDVSRTGNARDHINMHTTAAAAIRALGEKAK